MNHHDDRATDSRADHGIAHHVKPPAAAFSASLPRTMSSPFASAVTGTVFTLIVLLTFLMFSSMARAGSTTPVDLLTANDFAVLAASTITNAGCTTITGDVGLDPGTAVTGFGSCPDDANGVALTGALHIDDPVALQAQTDLVTAYNQAAGYPRTTIPTELGPSTPDPLLPGVYDSASTTFGITGTLTLDAGGDPNGVFIFYMGSTATSLTTAVGSSVVLQGQAQACNVFWVVAGTATLLGDSTFVGTIMANASITLGDNVTVDGRLLAQTGSVTLIHDTITRATCASGPGPTPTGGPTPFPTSTLPDSGDIGGGPTVALLALVGMIGVAWLLVRRRVRSRDVV